MIECLQGIRWCLRGYKKWNKNEPRLCVCVVLRRGGHQTSHHHSHNLLLHPDMMGTWAQGAAQLSSTKTQSKKIFYYTYGEQFFILEYYSRKNHKNIRRKAGKGRKDLHILQPTRTGPWWWTCLFLLGDPTLLFSVTSYHKSINIFFSFFFPLSIIIIITITVLLCIWCPSGYEKKRENVLTLRVMSLLDRHHHEQAGGQAGRRAGGSALLYFSSTRALMHFPLYSIHSTGWLWMRTTCLVGGYFSTITTWRDSPKSSILQVATRRRSKQNINNIPLSVDSFPIQLFLLFDLGWPFVRLLRLGYDSRFNAARRYFHRGAPFSSFLKKKKKDQKIKRYLRAV